MAPGIERDVTLQVRSAPVGHVRRLHQKLVESILSARIGAGVDLERIQRRAEGGDLRHRRRDTRLLGAAGEFWQHERGENAQNDEHEQEFDQRECTFTRVSEYWLAA